MWNDDFADHSLRSWMHRNQAPELLWELFVLYASPLAFTPIDFESETDRIVGSARDSGRLQTGQVRISLGAASSSSLTKMLTQSHARRSGGLILHLAAHGDEAGGLVLENSKGNGEAYRCTHEKLRQILQMGDRGLRGVSLLFLSSCSSKQLAQVFLECGCQHVIATSSPVLDATARAFTERFYGALFVGKSIVEAFEHTRKALLASSVREVADQSNVYHLLSAEGVGQVVPDVPERPERPGSRESEIGGFQDACSFQEQLTFLPPEVEDFFRPPEMQQVMNVLLNRRACAVHGCEGIGKSALLIETARFAASPGRQFSGNVVHVRLHDRSNAVKTIKEAVDFCSARLPCFLAETPGGPNGHARCIIWQLQQLERFRGNAPILLVIDDECNALERRSLRGLLAEVLRKTHKLRLLLGTSHASDEGTSEAREAQGLQELGCSKVVTIRLHGLDPATSVRLLLRRVHRPLEPHDLFPLEALSEGRARAQLRENREVAKLLVGSQILQPLEGNPGLIRQLGSRIVECGAPLRDVLQDMLWNRAEALSPRELD